jgi:hypothetical protein
MKLQISWQWHWQLPIRHHCARYGSTHAPDATLIYGVEGAVPAVEEIHEAAGGPTAYYY